MRPAHRFFALSLVAFAGCATRGASSNEQSMSPGSSAIAVMRDASGKDIGTLTIRETGEGLLTTGTLHGLARGTHGVHLHSVGRCEAPFASAGGHWNPGARQHGFDNPQGPHMGDMRNIIVGDDGTATVSTSTAGGTLRGAGGLLDSDGAAIIIHAGPDDYHSDPAGNSGARVACGVVVP